MQTHDYSPTQRSYSCHLERVKDQTNVINLSGIYFQLVPNFRLKNVLTTFQFPIHTHKSCFCNYSLPKEIKVATETT